MPKILNRLEEKPFRYLEKGIEAKGHALIYKMHKYFARRPHNVFRHLIEFYSSPGDIILDCFCGGGVSLVEGLAVKRKVIVSDVNALATFVSDCQTTPVNTDEYKAAILSIRESLSEFADKWFKTICRQCEETADIRWLELAYIVECVHCGTKTTLANANKTKIDGEFRNGAYDCQRCGRSFTSASVKRIAEEIIAVRVKCAHCKKQQSVKPINSEKLSYLASIKDFPRLIKQHDLWYPQEKIPDYWDRQREDCLHRKGFYRFSDLFTKRNLFFMAYFLQLVKMKKRRVSAETYKMLLFTFSATLRYTNNLNFATDSWMGGRPIAWAKHAFWTPNQFVEVNPLEYFDKRVRAIEFGLKNQQARLGDHLLKGSTFEEVRSGKKTHAVWNTSSHELKIPNNSIDLVVTDPPYGSNVQYGELCNFWLVWLRDELGLGKSLDIDAEIVVHRKQSLNKDYYKGYAEYQTGMLAVFRECYRVLKPGSALVFTFNNRDIRAWFAVLSAAIRSGFHLDQKGVIYQDAIGIYRDTSHARFSGALQGDFIYTFRKMNAPKSSMSTNGAKLDFDINRLVRSCARQLIDEKNEFTSSELHTAVIWRVLPALADLAGQKTSWNMNDIDKLLSLDQLIEAIGRTGEFVDNKGIWKWKGKFQ